MPTEADPALLLRPAGEADDRAVAEVHLAARHAAVRSGAMPPSVHPDEDTRSWLAARLREDEVWLAESERRVVAYARFTPTWLDDLYVLPSYAGRGVGSALLDLVKAQRPGGFCLWVFETNTPARAFYGGHGLVELERTDGTANEERAPDVRVAWPGEDPLGFLRGLIDDVDADLGDLLERRVALTAAVQGIKHDRTRDPDRERAIAATMAERAPTLGSERLARIMHAVITESLDAS
ncbi:GNAT family N-acetyltransferase [Nocardioides sp. W7]|uniref:GNAT family N-acetyltransferase n=1 Tax=Nocardioides sp. W7 TaxID=2931390 RepID=UPI001FD28606|nr:GNAT family N-acetyltransferase [Nocardioides sp. W7]